MDTTNRQITKIAREVRKFTIRSLRADGIGAGELDLLHAIRKNPGITQADVCKILGTDKSAVARQTASLETKGYLTRRENPVDGRSRILFATPKAEGLKNSKTQLETISYEWLLEELPDADRAEFVRLLDTLYHRMKTESKAGFPSLKQRGDTADA